MNNKVRVCRIPLVGQEANWYSPFWPKCTLVVTVADYAAARGWQLKWDKTDRALVFRVAEVNELKWEPCTDEIARAERSFGA